MIRFIHSRNDKILTLKQIRYVIIDSMTALKTIQRDIVKNTINYNTKKYLYSAKEGHVGKKGIKSQEQAENK